MSGHETFTTQVPEGDFMVLEQRARWLIKRAVDRGHSQTTWVVKGGEEPAVAQALVFARHDGTSVWLRVDDHQFRLIQSFRP
jgi:hypothetical protein